MHETNTGEQRLVEYSMVNFLLQVLNAVEVQDVVLNYSPTFQRKILV